MHVYLKFLTLLIYDIPLHHFPYLWNSQSLLSIKM